MGLKWPGLVQTTAKEPRSYIHIGPTKEWYPILE